MKKLYSIIRFSALITLICLHHLCFGQSVEWYNLIHDPNAKFSETVAKFESWWDGKPITKGSGYKQFQRWKYFMQDRLDEEGRQKGGRDNYDIFKQYVEERQISIQANGRSLPGVNWIESGPVDLPANGTGQPNGVGRVASIAFHPTDPDVIWLGSPAGGILKSTDYGSTWTNMSNSLSRLGVSSIVVHPDDPNTIYIGTGDRDGGDAPGRGVWKSSNGGNSWTSWNNGMGNRTVYEIIMHPANPDTMIASTSGRIYRTLDGGLNWNLVSTDGSFKDIAFHPTNPNIIYAAGNTYYRSVDLGLSWTKITSGLPPSLPQRISIAVGIDSPDEVYLIFGNGDGFQGLYKSINSGSDFVLKSNSPNIFGYAVDGGTGSQAWYDNVATVDPNDGDHIFVGAINIWESFDGGESWSIVSHWYGAGDNPNVHADQHVLTWSPHTGDLFAGHDGGIHYSSNGGSSFAEISNGLGISQIYKIGQSKLERDLTIAGFQDNGTAIIDNGNWRTEIGGDGMECIINYENSDIMFGSLYYGDIRRSSNRGINFSKIAGENYNGITEKGAWVTPYIIHPLHPDTMFAGYINIWRSLNCTASPNTSVSWTKISSHSGTSKTVDIAISPSNPDIMYYSRTNNTFYITENANSVNPVWIDLTANLPVNARVKDIEINPTNPSILWIAQQNNIYKSINAGASWTDVSGTLPNLNLNTIVAMPDGLNNALYVGMDVGVYYKDDLLSDWIYYGVDLPNTEVLELALYIDELNPVESKLVAATYGRGLWECTPYFVDQLAPGAEFIAAETSSCVGCEITFYDQSLNNPDNWNWEINPSSYQFVYGTNSASQHPVVQFLASGSYDISLTVTNENGSDLLTKSDYITVDPTILNLPVYEDFEALSSCPTASDCMDITCNLNNNWFNIENGLSDHIDWRVDANGTPSSSTGPSVDYNPGTTAGKYIYLEASSCFEHTGILKSQWISLVGTIMPEISFAYHMKGWDMGSLRFDIFADGIWHENVLPALIGEQGTSWKRDTLSLSPYIGKIIKFRFRGMTGQDYTSDIALDDIIIQDRPICIVNTTADSDIGSLRYCIENALPETEIFFSSNVHNDTIRLISDPLLINKNVILQGDTLNDIYIFGESVNQVFNVDSGISLEINNLKIISGTNAEGAGIINNGELTLTHVNIEKNASILISQTLLKNNGLLNILGNCNISEEP